MVWESARSGGGASRTSKAELLSRQVKGGVDFPCVVQLPNSRGCMGLKTNTEERCGVAGRGALQVQIIWQIAVKTARDLCAVGREYADD